MKLNFKDFARRVYEKATAEDITTNAAQVAFYFIFALFPLLLFILSVIGLVLASADDVNQELFSYLQQVIPGTAFTLIKDTLTEVTKNGSGGKLTLGILVALWSASAGIDSIRIALNGVYDLKERRSWWKYKLISTVLTLAISILIFIALGIVFYGSQFINVLLAPAGFSVDSHIILTAFSLVVIGIVLTTSFALIYSFAPDHTPFTWRWITPGTITAIILWLIFSGGFRIYLHYFNSYSKTYGSVGAIIILLLWLYLTALVILIGGVVNAVTDEISAENDKQVDASAIAKEKSQ